MLTSLDRCVWGDTVWRAQIIDVMVNITLKFLFINVAQMKFSSPRCGQRVCGSL
ncbi:hypothetical protein [Nonomuraea phyllanthi]|uniref:hypothetical protein n=1 Tax=Nonomuraea phyllanthi TaxID=2219224 RepID=UPI001293AC73|nr:hypothetical protein [Nonomuraea phyllanthi]